MEDYTILIMASALAFNILVLKWKIEHERHSDALLDGIVLVALGILFSGTITGLQIATVASAIVSIYLLIFPPKEYFHSFFDHLKENH